MRSLNLDQLRTLLQVVEHGSFSAAARRLSLTQPAVSLQIRELERRFGVRLIERLGKQAHATMPGRELVEAAQRIFRECNVADEAMRRYREGWIGRVHVGTTLTAMIYRLPPVLRRLRIEHAGIDLVVTNMPTQDSVEKIIQNKIDLALVTLPVDKRQLRITPLCLETLVAILPAATLDAPDEITPDYAARQPRAGGGRQTSDFMVRPLRPPLTRMLALIEHRNKPNEPALDIVRKALLTLRADRDVEPSRALDKRSRRLPKK